jgi:hypothetical protein
MNAMELGLGLSDDLEGPPEAVEVVHVERAEIDLHCLEEILQRHPLGFCLHAVDA